VVALLLVNEWARLNLKRIEMCAARYVYTSGTTPG
jgi:hypothetical protein